MNPASSNSPEKNSNNLNTPEGFHNSPQVNKQDYLKYHRSGAVLDDPKHVYDPNNENPKELLDRLRVAYYGIYDDHQKGEVSEEYLNQARDNYFIARDRVVEQIRREITAENEGESPEDLEKKINDALFDELVKREHDERIKANRQIREEDVIDKVIEKARNLLGTKAVKWYLRLDRKQRMALNFGVGTLAGLTFGAGVGALGALGYVGKRVASGSAGVFAGEWANKRWSIEELNQKEKQEIDDLKNSTDVDIDEKLEKFAEIEKRYKKERLKMTAKKIGVTALAGAGTGLLANTLEHAVSGVGLGGSSTIESKVDQQDVPQESFTQNRIPRMTLFIDPDPPVEPTTDISLDTPKDAGNGEINLGESDSAPETPNAENFSFTEEQLSHVPEKGDSNWRLLKETLEHNDRFSKLQHPGQKSFVIASINNKILGDPAKYAEGVGQNGEIVIGKEVNYSKLFEDKDFINKTLEDAKNLSMTKIKIWESNDAKVATWVKDPANSGKTLDGKVVDEILNTKPESEPVVIMPQAQSFRNLAGDDLGSVLDSENIESNTVLAGAGVLGVATLSKVKGEEVPKGVEEEIKAAKADIGTQTPKRSFEVIEGGNGKSGVAPVRSLEGDSKKAIASMMSAEEAQRHLENDINSIYGKEGILGIGKEKGVNTVEWKEIRNQKAKEFCNFYENRENCKLPKDIIESLNVSQKHRNLKGYIDFLKKEAKEATFGSESAPEGADVVPLDREDETVEKYLKRLGAFVAEHPRPKANEIAKGQVVEAALFKKAA